MKGWLQTRSTTFPPRFSPYFYRLHWGFLTRHLTQSSAASAKYFIHDATITPSKSSFRFQITLGPHGILHTEHTSPSPEDIHYTLIFVAPNPTAFNQWLTCLTRAIGRHFENWYQITRQIGRGGEGLVLEATGATGQKVAVKRLSLTDPAGVGARLHDVLREVMLQHKAAKRSPNVVGVVDVFFDNLFCWIVMPYVSGGSLAKLLETREGVLGEGFVRRIVTELGRCLMALHSGGVVHRDVKCDNVLLDWGRNGMSVLLGDFGYANVWREEVLHSTNSFCRGFVGTELYLAPEILKGDLYGAPVDVFSLGVLCHVCLTGEFPFQDGGAGKRELRVLQECERVGEDAKQFCRALLNRDCRKRLTAAALLQHRWIRGGQNVAAGPRRRPSETVHSSVVFKRSFHVIVAVRRLKKVWINSRRRFAIDMGEEREESWMAEDWGVGSEQGRGVGRGRGREEERVEFYPSNLSDETVQGCSAASLRCFHNLNVHL